MQECKMTQQKIVRNNGDNSPMLISTSEFLNIPNPIYKTNLQAIHLTSVVAFRETQAVHLSKKCRKIFK